tara:strand:- start:2054 stop:3226 length:1173 start_codon:yes stop_codon:yes gene_type:complete
MSWIKQIITVTFFSLITVIIIDLIAFPFKEKFQVFLPLYGVEIDNFSRGYPVGHFSHDDSLGFDITPSFRTQTSIKPIGYKAYAVWGNTYGCFDDEWATDSLKGGIYLAGDSFTWGYTRYDKKFGTILERLLDTKVYACGVTHTGQAHQFNKFMRLFEEGLRPKAVIVNIVSNDLDNDFFFPHTDIIDGLMVENVEVCGDPILSSDFNYKRFDRTETKNYMLKKMLEPSFRSYLREYSLSANVIAGITSKIRFQYNRLAKKQTSACRRSAYAGLSKISDLYPNSHYTAQNRENITNWIAHANQNDYRLIFSFIPSKGVTRDPTYPFIQKFIEDLSGEYKSFDTHCDLECRMLNNVYYETDEHFNEVGNQLYAKYLYEILANTRLKEIQTR